MKTILPALSTAASALLLSACTTPPARPEPVDPPGAAADQCGSDKLGAYLNTPADDAALAKIRAAAGHDRIRVIRPGMAVTMDYRADRLNVDIGDDGRIRRLYCS